jgi:multidrug efflux pump subunit AcrA (membrane-fusion protein)
MFVRSRRVAPRRRDRTNIGDEFVRRTLETVVETLGARAAALWNLSSKGVLSLAGDVRLAETGVTRDPAVSRVNVSRLLEVTRHGEAAWFDPQPAQRIEAPAPVVLIAPVKSSQACLGALEIFIDESLSASPRAESLQFAAEVCGSIGWFLSWREESQSAPVNLDFWQRFERAACTLHESLDPQQVAMNAVHEGRRLLGCDRLSLVVQRGRRTIVLAVSGQERINHSSNLVRSVADVAAPAIQGNCEIGSLNDGGRLPPTIEKRVVAHLQTSGARLLKVLPLCVPQPAADSAEPRRRNTQARAFGALVVEYFSVDRLSPVTTERWNRFAGQTAVALANARSHERVFLLPLRRAVGRCGEWLTGRRLMKLLLGLLFAAGTAAALVAVPATYRVEGTGRLMPAVQRNVFAPWDGEVTELLVAGGDRVVPGQPLLQLRNDELQTQLLASRNRLAEKQQQLEALQAEIDESPRRALRPDEAVRLRGRLAQVQIELEGAAERTAALEQQVEMLTVRAPIGGTIAGFQVEQLLLNRPVRRGEVLLEVMDEEGDWRLELTVPERRMGHLLNAARARPDARLPAEFVLATIPEKTFQGTVEQVSTRTDVLSDQGPVVDVFVAADAAEIGPLRIGAEAVARIDCGSRSLGYVLFGDAVEFIQRRLW